MDEEDEPTSGLENKTPDSILYGFKAVIEFFQAYGWFVIIGVVALLYLKTKLAPLVNQYKKKREEQLEYEQYNPDTAARHQEQMETNRRRLQEKHDTNSAMYAEKRKEVDEQKRKERIEDWDRHQQGKGYRSKYKPKESEGTDKTVKAKKSTLRRDDYSPLMGSGSGTSLRPPRRGGTAGGG